jgi:hypothetical protein
MNALIDDFHAFLQAIQATAMGMDRAGEVRV